LIFDNRREKALFPSPQVINIIIEISLQSSPQGYQKGKLSRKIQTTEGANMNHDFTLISKPHEIL